MTDATMTTATPEIAAFWEAVASLSETALNRGTSGDDMHPPVEVRAEWARSNQALHTIDERLRLQIGTGHAGRFLLEIDASLSDMTAVTDLATETGGQVPDRTDPRYAARIETILAARTASRQECAPAVAAILAGIPSRLAERFHVRADPDLTVAASLA